MDLEIRYATTSSGVNVAFGVAGEGYPLVFFSPPPFCHVQLDWDEAVSSAWHAYASAFRFYWFDWHGAGMSDRQAGDFTLAAMLRDAEAVVARAALERFAVVSHLFSVPIAVAYAAAHPEQVSHLVLADGFAQPDDWSGAPWAVMERAIREHDWTLYTETIARVFGADLDEAGILDVAPYLRACVEQRTMQAIFEAIEQYDVASLLPAVVMPTLVVASGRGMAAPATTSQRLAAAIPNATYRHAGNTFAGLPEACIEFVLGLKRETPVAMTSMRTVLFTDIVGHTEMMQRLGDAKGRDVLREHERITRETLRQHAGAEVKTMGDGFMASFGSVTRAMDCAIALQRAFAEHTKAMAEPLHVRVGLNAGEPIEEAGDLFGSTVIMASRVCAQANAGEILIPEPVRHLLSGKNYIYADRGETVVKGFEHAVRLYEVRWRD